MVFLPEIWKHKAMVFLPEIWEAQANGILT